MKFKDVVKELFKFVFTEYKLGSLGIVLILAFAVIAYVACYGQPHVWNMAFKHVPWYGWVLFVTGTICYLIDFLRKRG